MNIAHDTAPRAEGLLAAAHRELGKLRDRRKALAITGINPLPDELTIMAFAMLGDHDRDKPLEELRAHWSDLQSKGLAQGSIDTASTPVLRLLANILKQTEAIAPLWMQLRGAVDATKPPQGVWLSVSRIRGLWGQWARLHFNVQEVEHLLIDPDPVFGLQPALLEVDPYASHSGSFPFPIDNGAITIHMRHRSGEIYRQVIEAMVEGVA